MKRTLTLLLISFSALWAEAQEKTGRITGSVTDAAGKPLEAATVQAMKADGKTLVKTALTDKQGIFEIEKLATGKYMLSVTAVGYTAGRSAVPDITASSNSVTVPAIQLAVASKELGGVTVTGQRPLVEQKMDRTVINVDTAPTNAGSTAMEV